ncbi:MAG: hypothetical protein IKY29_00815 [Clostridia bacterium]|nr:hypothetical protein [Clostridia bacterium]
MKKVIAVLLVAVLSLTMVLSVSAENKTWTDDDTGISYLQIFDCDTKPGGTNSYTVDTNDAQEGEGCLVLQVGDGKVNEMLPAEPIDGSEYDTLEFDMYVSSLTIFDLFFGPGKNSGFEITSSGTCDYQEISWILADIRDFHAGEELVEGWNHIILPLSTGTVRESGTTAGKEDLAGPLDPSNINYLRFFMVNDSAGDIVIKLDNICLSDRQAVNAEAEKQAAAKKAAEKVVEKINELPEITAENYQDYKLKTASCRSMYEKLSEDALTYVPKSVLDKLIAAETAIADFEANPPSDENPDENPEENPEDTTGGDDQTTENKGCKGMVGVGAVAMIVMALSLGVTALKKKD